MDYYQILEVSNNAADTDLRKGFLKLAKKYHPDVYKGPHKDHFKKVLEAYNTLKSPVKRSDYDKHNRLKSARSSRDFQDFERRMKQEGKDPSHEAYEKMKASQKTVRETVDPEFEAAFRKLNLNRLFNEFNARPLMSQPEELHQNIMQPVSRLKMSKRDLARARFVQQHNRKRQIIGSFKNTIIVESEKLKDVQEGVANLKKMTYKEMVEDINKDLRALEQIERPVALYKEEKQDIAERLQKQDESLNKLKRVVWPVWAVVILVNSLLMIGYYR
jgi:curved DNA-binding protein CbpA